MPVYNPEPLASIEAMSDKTVLSTPALTDHTLDPGTTTVTKTRKRKAATSAAPPPPIKKQNIDSPISTRQRKVVGKPKYKTAKERFQAASAEDTRPLPLGEPEVWAEVWFPCIWMSTFKTKQILDSP